MNDTTGDRDVALTAFDDLEIIELDSRIDLSIDFVGLSEDNGNCPTCNGGCLAGCNNNCNANCVAKCGGC
jgi:hypothetical protein